MISLQRIARLASMPTADASNAALLLDEILASTRPLPLAARLHLESEAVLPVVALGLGLSRFIDLTFAHSQHTIELTERLLAHQDETGSFGSVSATAVAGAALLGASTQFSRSTHQAIDELRQRCSIAADAALAWLSEQFTPAPSAGWLFPPIAQGVGQQDQDDDQMLAFWSGESPETTGRACEPIEAAIALWQLASHSEAGRRLDFEGILSALEQSGARHDRAVAQLLERACQALACNPPVEMPMFTDRIEAA